MQVFQVGLALQLHSSTKGRHWAAAKSFCHAGKVITKLQHLLQLYHLHLIRGCCPATGRTVIGLAVLTEERHGCDVFTTHLSTSPLRCYFHSACHAVQCSLKVSPTGLLNIPSLQSVVISLSAACWQANQLALTFARLHAIAKEMSQNTTCNRHSMLTFSYHCLSTARMLDRACCTSRYACLPINKQRMQQNAA